MKIKFMIKNTLNLFLIISLFFLTSCLEKAQEEKDEDYFKKISKNNYPHENIPNFYTTEHGKRFLVASENCQECHGKDYKGGKSKRSCYDKDCHPSFPHIKFSCKPGDKNCKHAKEYLDNVIVKNNPRYCNLCHDKEKNEKKQLSDVERKAYTKKPECIECHVTFPHNERFKKCDLFEGSCDHGQTYLHQKKSSDNSKENEKSLVNAVVGKIANVIGLNKEIQSLSEKEKPNCFVCHWQKRNKIPQLKDDKISLTMKMDTIRSCRECHFFPHNEKYNLIEKELEREGNLNDKKDEADKSDKADKADIDKQDNNCKVKSFCDHGKVYLKLQDNPKTSDLSMKNKDQACINCHDVRKKENEEERELVVFKNCKDCHNFPHYPKETWAKKREENKNKFITKHGSCFVCEYNAKNNINDNNNGNYNCAQECYVNNIIEDNNGSMISNASDNLDLGDSNAFNSQKADCLTCHNETKNKKFSEISLCSSCHVVNIPHKAEFIDMAHHPLSCDYETRKFDGLNLSSDKKYHNIISKKHLIECATCHIGSQFVFNNFENLDKISPDKFDRLFPKTILSDFMKQNNGMGKCFECHSDKLTSSCGVLYDFSNNPSGSEGSNNSGKNNHQDEVKNKMNDLKATNKNCKSCHQYEEKDEGLHYVPAKMKAMEEEGKACAACHKYSFLTGKN